MRRARHRLLAAGDDDLGVPGLDRLGGEHDRLEARAAHLIDGERRNGGRQAGLDERLAGGRLAGAALNHLAEDDFFDRAGVDAGPDHRVTNDHGAELGRGEGGKTAEIPPDGGAYGGEDDGCRAVAHTDRSDEV